MEAVDQRWRKAFARQSLSDLKVYERLCTEGWGLPHCHRLHYLQMHLEKLAKAFCWDPEELRNNIPEFDRTHSVAAKVLPIVVGQFAREGGYDPSVVGRKLTQIRQICREVDLLSPAVRDGEKRPDNTEYPWASQDGKSIIAPCERKFPIDSRLRNPEGKMLLKIASWLTHKLATS